MRAIALILVALAISAFADQQNKSDEAVSRSDDSNNVPLSDICQPYDRNGKIVSYPFPGGIAGRKLLSSPKDVDDIELRNNGRELSSRTMSWAFWQTKKGKCVTTTSLPPSFVSAATKPNVKVSPGKSCAMADFMGMLTDNIVAYYQSECPDSTAQDLLLNRICYYYYGSRQSSKISGKFICKSGASTQITNVWAEQYPYSCPACITVGTWY